MVDRGKAAVAVVTQEFEMVAHTMAANAGRAALRVHVLPYPLDSRPEGEVREIARQHYRQVMRALGVRGRLAGEPPTGG